MDFQKIMTQMGILFFLMSIGYLCNKCHVIGQKENKTLSNLVMMVGVPGLIIGSVANGSPFPNQNQLFQVLLIVSITNIMLVPLAKLAVTLLRVKEDRFLNEFMLIFPNAGFMGFPVIAAIFGNDALIYAALFQLPHNILMYTYGIHLMNQKGIVKLNIRAMINPCIIAAIIACILCLADVKQPAIIAQSAIYLGNITTPLGMLIIGCSLADVDMKHIFDDLRVIPFIFVKLMLLPILIFLITSLFVENQMLRYVVTTIIAMPVAANAVILANVYDGNVQLSSKTIFLTTLASIVSIPLICALLFR